MQVFLRFIGTVGILLGALLYTATSDPLSSPTLPHPEFADALWVAASDRVLKIAMGDGTVLFEVPHPGGFQVLAVDEQAGILWAYSDGILYAYSFAGELLSASPVVTDPRDDNDHEDREADDDDEEGIPPLALLANANDSSVWLARHKTLFHFDAQGQVRNRIVFPHRVEAIALDTSRDRLWVATRKTLTAYDSSGALIIRLAPRGSERFRALVSAPTDDVLWAAIDKDTLRRYAAETGRVEFESSLAERPEALAVDHQGGLWVAAGKSLHKLDAAGQEIWQLQPFHRKEQKHIVALVADPIDHWVWVASHDTVRQVSADGTVRPPLALSTGKKQPKIRALTLYVDVLPPVLTIAQPQEDSFSNTHYPSMTLHYSDTGLGVDPQTLELLVNEQAIAMHCDVQPDSASCTPTSPLPEGHNLLRAMVRDFHGNPSPAAQVTFVVDTIPPVPVATGSITVSEPVAGQVTLTGAPGGAEPFAAITVTNLRTGTSVTVQAGSDGSVMASLAAEAGDSFTVVVTDAAGNTSTVVTLTGIRLTITITTPGEGAAVQADRVRVTGILQAPQHTGVTVNGVVALVDGEQFVANHVPLQAGVNTLTAVATDSTGRTATTSVTVQHVAVPHTLRLIADTYMGLAPFETALRLDGSFDITMSFLTATGPGSIELVTGASPTEHLVRIPAAGLYTLTAEAYDSTGNVYTDTLTIQILDRTMLDTRLQATWNGMKQALIRQDMPQALRYFTDETKELYQEVFTALATKLPQLVQEMQDIQMIYAEDAAAKYRIRRTQVYGGQPLTITYYIYFRVDDDGLWKIMRY